jgi:hypothetical protein
VTFTNIPFNTVVVAGDPIAALNGTYVFTSSGSGYSFDTGTHTLTNTGSFTLGGNTASGQLITMTNPSVLAYTTNGDIDAEVGFSNSATSTVTILAALLTDLGISGPYTATLVQDAHCLSTAPGTYPNPSPGMACAAGYGPNPLSRSVDSQYLEVSITTGTVPEPGSALMLGLGLLAIGGGLVRRRRSTK